ncbi:MAG: asparaginase, partial [Fibrobacter sp.]|nr:asparaginase [Fibrobacter sp.]
MASKKKHIVILATGGTIAGVGEPGKNTGYVSGQISAEDLVKSVPELSDYAEITAEQICNVNSDDMTDKLWIKLSNRIAELQEDDSVDGIVVTHGTDTMDETAYFVSLTVKCEKAVIFTGSMKPATAKNPDGPENLLGAVRAAAGFAVDDDPPANLVWVYFAGELFDARSVQKCSASAINAMGVNAPGEGSNWNALKEQNFFDVSK